MSNIALGGTQGNSKDTPDAKAVVTLDASLKAGTYTFSLLVIDDLGNQSKPATVQVLVHDLPVAKITGPTTPVITGQPINLDGSGSTPAGNIKTYRWQLVTGASPVG
jgi:hypothetical protein